VADLRDDLEAEHLDLEAVVVDLDDAGWDRATPGGAGGAPWLVRDQIGHLTYFDRMGALSATDPDAFEAHREHALADMVAFEAESMRPGRELAGPALLAEWRSARARMLEALGSVADGARLPWYGPPMSLRSFMTARLMETWAHGQDVVDALHASRPPTDRLAHVAFIGCATRGWSYVVRDREPRDEPVFVELALPSGAPWTNGPADAASSVRGDAFDFCLVVTQRRNVADTGLAVSGDAAHEWMSIAQCFAGAPTLPPDPGSRLFVG
jgi:uncharacterized protein (TIGR03084 family)